MEPSGNLISSGSSGRVGGRETYTEKGKCKVVYNMKKQYGSTV